MRKMNLWLFTAILLITALGIRYLLPEHTAPQSAAQNNPPVEEKAVPTFSNNTVKYGSYGQDVYELQGRLKYLGFYNGKIDSNFGSSTLKSVKWFQSEFGMKADGVVGAKTKLKLYNASTKWSPTEPPLHKEGASGGDTGGGGEPSSNEKDNMGSANALGLSENELKIMANAVYGEARGEPFEGQVAVAAVILNRVNSTSFPSTPSGVIFQPGAFTAVADGQIYLEPNAQAKKAVEQALNGWDPSGGCLYYFNPKTATSKWIWTRPQVKTIGQHIFCM
ncbi:spore cortex-lytic enzyme [Paenibacillus polysaccharolyticus]|uniref:Spore cortex-lytic enzyme n=1 Tax=Paenibacillus polysaccharolyticus TaxID=582692 RepID=A0A1G5KVL5_9BACL|nr:MULTISPECIES: spore cortex-lytic enzyme [Paenibacillus]MCP1134550.1 spore cortex-lytic enzyme [Paenibacillus polysaccharolyticus]MDP9698432.1 N-acetylmuramoyl-L-alanine amidase [Paenibacillus intestini]SCZ03979.1 N-acetylmuramoyl-L-alanine amidase [Paenibacillus polysaccharolyticus]